MHANVHVVTRTDGINAIVSEAKKRNIALKGARAAGKILRSAARTTAPRRKGRGGGSLKAAQAVLAKKGRRGLTLAFAVQGAAKKYDRQVLLKGRKKSTRIVPAFYDHLVQLGTRAHRTGKGESLGRTATKRRGVVAATSQAKGGRHPGTRPNPYRKRAWGSVKGLAGQAALTAMGQATQTEIAKQAAKVFAKATKR